MTEKSDLTRIWDRQPSETKKAFTAFSAYLKMPVFGQEGETRTLKNVALKLGYKFPTQVAEWSSQFNWQERAASYDNWVGSKSLTMVETGLDAFRKSHITRVTQDLVIAFELIEKRMKQIKDSLDAGIPIDTIDLKRIVSSLNEADVIGRRASGMPTSYSSEDGDEPIDKDGTQKYIIGGD